MESRSHWPVTLLSGASAVINMLMPLVLVRLLSVEEVGDYKIFFLYLMILPDLCVSSGLMNGLSYWAGRGERGLAAMSATHLLALIVAVSVIAVFTVFDGLLTTIIPNIHYPLLFTLAAGGALISRFYEETNIALGNTWKGALFHSVGEGVRAICILVVALVTHSYVAVLVAHTAVSLSKSLLGYVLLYRQGLLSLSVEIGVWKEVWKYSFPVALAGVFSFIVAHIDQLLLSHTLSPEDFAIYAIGCLVIPPLIILEHSVTRVFIPVLSSALEQCQAEYARKLYSSAVDQIGFLVIPAVCGLAVFAEPIIHLLFTEKYGAAVPYLTIFAFSYLALLIPYDAVARAEGDSRWILVTFIRFGLFALLLGLTLVHLFGAMGALAALLLAQFSLRGYGLSYAARRLDSSIWSLIPFESLGRMLVVSLVLSVLSLLFQPLFSSEFVWLAVCGSSFFVVYLASYLFWKSDVQSSERVRQVTALLPHLTKGGLENMVLTLARGIHNHDDFRVSVFCFDYEPEYRGDDLSQSFQDSGIEVSTHVKKRGFSPRLLSKLVFYVIQRKVCVLHTHDLGSLLYGGLTKLLCPHRIKLIHTQHSFVHFQREQKYRTYERLFTKLADRVVCVSESVKDGYRSLGIESSKLEIISNGIVLPVEGTRDSMKARKELLAGELHSDSCKDLKDCVDSKWIVHMGRIFQGKGQREALEIWSNLSEQSRAVSLLFLVGPIACANEYNKILEIHRTLPARERVIIVPGTNNPYRWYEAASALLSCSLEEGHPLCPIEALAVETPLILSDIPAHRFLQRWSQSLEIENLSLASTVLDRLLSTEQSISRKNLSEGSKYVRRKFSAHEMVLRYATLYGRNETPQSQCPFSNLQLKSGEAS